MFPEENDFIEVDSEGHSCHGLIGKVVSTYSDKVVVSLYGRETTVAPQNVRIKAKVGSRAHAIMARKASQWELNSLDKIGLYALMDIALWMRDYEWCEDIYQRMKTAK
ncbi:hypothetical protein SECTIM467_84 [Brevibacillus phage SecTim467]|uniref:Uncharacterized protein n=2 Tax=Jenstvirus jenst TaxID=1982225 RepID=A0A0K2CNY0_9CAUD|nr:hypothetical protein AVV11_gp112 [Brevibacillus phage Jenst]ALA07208.1 hypothetical protein JENST_79 [Brevibacillus phage Jenst]ALA07428.1 hypothetical protein SECTIM467_84 [Brevibacillus phage SecTim467]